MQTIDLSALIGSRICHDLISPISAIGNGVELMQLSGVEQTPEIELIAQSVKNANARIRFFRIAFGGRGSQTSISRTEISDILRTISDGNRLSYDWPMVQDQPRDNVQLVFLALLCVETAMPFGGSIEIQTHDQNFEIHATADRIKIDKDQWNALRDRPVTADLSASHVQFALLPKHASEANRQIDVVTDEQSGRIMIRV